VTELVALFLIIAFSAYTLFGGADFGGGLLEATLPSPRLRARLQATLAPVWEANHVWLIAVIVILFVGFPKFYAESMTRLFVPVSCALLAILVRGTFFTLRKYDPAPPPLMARLYSALFRLSSAVAPLFFGFIVAGLLSVHPGSPAGVPRGASFGAVFLAPWLNGFGLLVGLFVTCLFGYLAAVFFYGEVRAPDERALIWRRILAFFGGTFFLGGAVLATGAITGRVSLAQGWHPLQLVCQAIAGAGIIAMWRGRRSDSPWVLRLAVGAQVLAILGGWFLAQAPIMLRTTSGNLTIYDAAAPPVTQLSLLIGLVVVLALVIPALVWLYRVFAAAQTDEHD